MDNFSGIGSHISNQNNKHHNQHEIDPATAAAAAAHLSRAPSAMDPLMTGTLQSMQSHQTNVRHYLIFITILSCESCFKNLRFLVL